MFNLIYIITVFFFFFFSYSKVEINLESENEIPIWKEAIVRNIDRTTHTIAVEVIHKDSTSTPALASASASPSSIYLEMDQGKDNHLSSTSAAAPDSAPDSAPALLSYSLYSEQVCKLYTHTSRPVRHHLNSNHDTDDDDDDDNELDSLFSTKQKKTKAITTYGRSSASSASSASSQPYKLSGTTAPPSPSPSSSSAYSMGYGSSYGSGYGSGRRHSAGKPLTVNGTVGLGRHTYYAYIMYIVK